MQIEEYNYAVDLNKTKERSTRGNEVSINARRKEEKAKSQQKRKEKKNTLLSIEIKESSENK